MSNNTVKDATLKARVELERVSHAAAVGESADGSGILLASMGWESAAVSMSYLACSLGLLIHLQQHWHFSKNDPLLMSVIKELKKVSQLDVAHVSLRRLEFA